MRRVALVFLLALVASAAAVSTASATPSATCAPQSCDTWQQGPVSITWTDSAGDPSVCPNSTNTESTDTAGTPVSCDDGDGDPPVTINVKIDKHGPTLSPTEDRAPDSNGWFNHPVGLLLNPTDALSGVASCDAPVYSGPDDAGATLSGTCTDNAGNVSDVGSVNFKYDATPPAVTASLDRPPDHNGWFNHPVGLVLQDTDSLSGPGPCQPATYSGPDGASAVASGTCTDMAGNVGVGSVSLPYDASPPAVTGASADRPPDHNGWYNHPVSFTFNGADALSGIAGCTTASYSGPVNASAAVNGACSDKAGNIGLGNQRFKYDDVRPSAPQVQITPGNRRVDLSWTLPKDADQVTVTRAQQGSSAAPVVVYSGTAGSFLDKRLTNGVKYRYAVSDSDQAGNTTTNVVRAIPTASSLRPFVGSVVSGPPLLTWRTVKGARYYNVQLFYGKKKVLSIWPRKASLQLKPRWHFRGKTHRFTPGHYRWYVWPGFGPLSAHRYGHRLGRSSFRAT